jgi:uncharacterized 2Fe-2S/4Fe-4S cluster protein (DUF4445 family)
MDIHLFPAQPENAVSCSPQQTLREAPVRIRADSGTSLSAAIWLSGQVQALPLCVGLGRCGRCRVRFVHKAPTPLTAEKELFTEQELAAGWRLACRRLVPEPQEYPDALALELPAADFFLPDRRSKALTAAADQDLDLAVDLGSTSVYWRALAGAAVLAEGHFLNPQAGAGPDVMSRLAAVCAGKGAVLAGLLRRALRSLIEDLADRGRVKRLCVAANTAMTDIFLQRPVRGLCAAPYRLSHAGNIEVELEGLPPVYIPPLPAPFVGGDVSAGLAALLEGDIPRPFVFADLGTNAELALMDGKDSLYLTSIPLGPALEGIGMQCGQLAGPGVVTGFRLSPSGLVPQVCEEGPAGTAARKVRGISATGYLSLLAILLRLGLLDREGHFVPAPAMPLARKLAACLEEGRDGLRLSLPYGLWLAAADVEELLKIKAAFSFALEYLLAAAQTAAEDLAAFFLAGSLGRYIQHDDLATLAFMPASLAARSRAMGNMALEGAAFMLRHPEKRTALAQLCARARVLSLADGADFEKNYLRHMRFGV